MTQVAFEDLARLLKKLYGPCGTVPDGLIELRGDHRDPLVAERPGLAFPVKPSGG